MRPRRILDANLTRKESVQWPLSAIEMTSLMKWVFASLFVISAAAAHIRLTRGSVASSRARSQCCSCCALRGLCGLIAIFQGHEKILVEVKQGSEDKELHQLIVAL